MAGDYAIPVWWSIYNGVVGIDDGVLCVLSAEVETDEGVITLIDPHMELPESVINRLLNEAREAYRENNTIVNEFN